MSEEIGLSEPIKRKCKKIFKECRQFNSIDELQDVFNSDGLREHKFDLPQLNTTNARIENIIPNLDKWGFHEDSPIILLFLRQLFPLSQGDLLYRELEKLYIDIDTFVYQKHPRHYQPFSSLAISPEIVADIVNVLLKCPSMRSEEYRKKIWCGLYSDEIGYSESGVDVVDVFAFIWSFSSANDIQRLVQMIHIYEGDSEEWKSLKFTWLKKTKELAYLPLRALEEIIERMNLPEVVWRNAYRLSHPGEEEEPLRGVLLFASMEDLWLKSISSSGMQPILVFTERLAQYAEEHQQLEIAHELRTWTIGRANALRIPLGNLITLRSKIQKQNRSTDKNFYLLVALEPNDGSNTFHMRAWLYNSENEIVDHHFFLYIEGDLKAIEHLLLSEIPPVFNDLLKQCEERLRSGEEAAQQRRELRIEFLLPLSLLNYPVEQWIFNDGFMNDELGVQYQVVVRSYDRYRKISAQRNWKNKWLDLRAIIDEARTPNADTRAIWVCGEEQYQDPRAMKAALLRHCTLCLALTFASSLNLLKSPNCFDAILSAGIPVVLWPREPLPEIKEFFHKTLSWEFVDTLPNLVQEQRREAVMQGNANHHGRHLALLWDDPRRLPPVAEDEVPSFSSPE